MRFWVIILLFIMMQNAHAQSHLPDSTFFWKPDFWNAVLHDTQAHYSLRGISYTLGGLAIGGLTANTHIDQEIRDYWQDHLRNQRIDNISDIVERITTIRQIQVVIPTYLTGMILAANFPESKPLNEFGQWGNRSLRALFQGAPQQAIFTEMLGAARPTIGNSHWHWFEDSRGVSGHAFYGAIPMVSAAKQADNIYFKSLFYALSVLPALSRINDDKHYFSQAFLGWFFAYTAATSVDINIRQQQERKLSYQFFATPKMMYLGASYQL